MASRLWSWIDSRMPSLKEEWRKHAAEYYAPKNFNFWYFFGSLALLVLVIQIVSGIFLTMNYKPDANLAFGSIDYIMRDVPGGWIIRYIHSTGASAFFIVVYLHMFRAMLYGSHKEPRELVWIFGMLIYLTLMGEAFFGYLLPWGQMSYWGAQVIVNLFGTVPFIGPDLALWIRGDYVVSDVTLKTPQHIAPVWYFTPYYSVLRAVPPLFHSQFPGVLAMGAAVLILFFLPWLDRSPVRSIRYRGPRYKSALAIFIVVFLILGFLGTEPTTVWGQFGFEAFFLDTKERATWAARLCTLAYFLFFILMPWYTARDKVKPVPERVTH